MIDSLTPREREAWDAMAARPTDTREEIARRLCMTTNCLSALLTKARKKLGVEAKRGRPRSRMSVRVSSSRRNRWPRSYVGEFEDDDEPLDVPEYQLEARAA